METEEYQTRYMTLLDELFEHWSSRDMVEIIERAVMTCIPYRIESMIRERTCLISYNIDEPVIRGKLLL